MSSQLNYPWMEQHLRLNIYKEPFESRLSIRQRVKRLFFIGIEIIVNMTSDFNLFNSLLFIQITILDRLRQMMRQDTVTFL